MSHSIPSEKQPSVPVPSDSSERVPSAFPVLPKNPDELPPIPGGWQQVEYPIGARTLQVYRPIDPDLFLDDETVQRENARHDYMPYWAFLWPSALSMAAAVQHAAWPAGTSLLELGAGIGLVGLAAALRGDQVTYSDYDRTALHLCRLNSRLNQLGDPELLFLDWRAPPQRQFPAIMGCEVTYDADLHIALLETIDQLLTAQGVCWLGDPGRYQARFFVEKARSRGWQVDLLDAQGKPRQDFASGEFQIMALRRASGCVAVPAADSQTPA